MKRVFLVILMLSFLAPMEMEARKKWFGYGCYWEIKKGVLIISGNGRMWDFDSSFSRPWHDKTFEGIIIEDGITTIGENALSGFFSCKARYVVIPNTVTRIGENAFESCSGLTSVTISDIAAWCNIRFEEYDSNPLYYAHHLYMNGKEVQNLIIPNSVTSIGHDAFYGCSGLMSVTIPNSVTSIGYRAFRDCSGLTSVTIPNSVTSIGERAFYGCSSLTSVTIPNSVTSIGEAAFDNCRSLTSITIPNSVTSIPKYAFSSCSSLTSVTIPKSVTSIDSWAFDNCSRLKSVNISDIAAWCNIWYNNFDSNPLNYAHHLYLNGKEVQDLVIPNSVTSIGSYAFYNCSSLKSVTIPNSVKSIGDNAFYGCNNLKYITAPDIADRKKCFTGNNAKLRKLITGPNNDSYYLCEGGLMDGNYGWIIPQGTYNDIIQCTANHLIVKKGSKYGLITFDGKEIVAPDLDKLESAGPDYLRYKINGFCGVMNYAGKTIIPTDRGYTYIGDFVPFTKRFPYAMNGYKGECNHLGQQLSKIKVETPKQSVASSTSDRKKPTIVESGSNFEHFSYFSYYKVTNGNIDVKPNSCEGVKFDFSSNAKIIVSLMKNGNATESITIIPSDATLTKKDDVVIMLFTNYGITKAIMIIKSFNGMSKAIAWYDNFSSDTGKMFGESGLGNGMQLIDNMNKYRGSNFDSQFSRVKSRLESYSWKNKN